LLTEPARALPIAALLCAYALFGAGYIADTTFMIALVQSAGGGAVPQATFWAVIGLAAMASPWLSEPASSATCCTAVPSPS
jgi:hypothetical protein